MPLASSTDPGAPVRVSPRCIEQLNGWAAWRAPAVRHGWPEPANDWREGEADSAERDAASSDGPPRHGAVIAGFVTALMLCVLAGAVFD